MKRKPVRFTLSLQKDASGFVELTCACCDPPFRVQTLASEMWCPYCGRKQGVLHLLPPDKKMKAIQELRLIIWGKKEFK